MALLRGELVLMPQRDETFIFTAHYVIHEPLTTDLLVFSASTVTFCHVTQAAPVSSLR